MAEDKAQLTMLDYVKRMKPEGFSAEAQLQLSKLPWPMDPCPTCGHFPDHPPR